MSEARDASTPDLGLPGVLNALGERVRSLRMQRGLTIHEVALQSGISASMVSTVERGQTSASVGTLHSLAETLGVSLNALFLSDGSEDPVTPRSEQVVERTAGGVVRTIVTSHGDNGIEVYDDTYPVGTSHAPRPARHLGWEYGLVIDGRLSVELDESRFELGAGDSIQFAAERVHLLSNIAEGTTRAIWVNLRRF